MVFMDNLDERVLAVIQRYTDQHEPVTYEVIEMELPSVDMVEIKASVQRLQEQEIVRGWLLNEHIPYKEK
jgi:hypothetical protein